MKTLTMREREQSEQQSHIVDSYQQVAVPQHLKK